MASAQASKQARETVPKIATHLARHDDARVVRRHERGARLSDDARARGLAPLHGGRAERQLGARGAHGRHLDRGRALGHHDARGRAAARRGRRRERRRVVAAAVRRHAARGVARRQGEHRVARPAVLERARHLQRLRLEVQARLGGGEGVEPGGAQHGRAAHVGRDAAGGRAHGGQRRAVLGGVLLLLLVLGRGGGGGVLWLLRVGGGDGGGHRSPCSLLLPSSSLVRRRGAAAARGVGAMTGPWVGGWVAGVGGWVERSSMRCARTDGGRALEAKGQKDAHCVDRTRDLSLTKGALLTTELSRPKRCKPSKK